MLALPAVRRLASLLPTPCSQPLPRAARTTDSSLCLAAAQVQPIALRMVRSLSLQQQAALCSSLDQASRDAFLARVGMPSVLSKLVLSPAVKRHAKKMQQLQDIISDSVSKRRGGWLRTLG